MTAQLNATVIAQINCYPYKCQHGSRAFQEHHMGLSKLTIYKESDGSYKLVALRQDDLVVIDSFQLTGDFRVRYTKSEHFLMFLDKGTGNIYGFGTCKDESSVKKTEEFASTVTSTAATLHQDRMLTRQNSRSASSLQDISSSKSTTNKNIDAITAFLPTTIQETQTGPIDDNGDEISITRDLGTTEKSSGMIHTSPSISKPNGAQSDLQTKTHIPIIMQQTSVPPTDAAKAEKITAANLKRHRDSITHDPNAVPLQLRTSERPDPQPTGVDNYYDNTVAKLGALEVIQRENIKENADADSNASMSKPYKVEHKTHMSFGKDGFKGVPVDWIIELQRQFGVELSQLPASIVTGYSAKIPYVLQTLRDLLIDKGGLQTTGIFRLAPELKENDQAKDDIDKGLLLSKAAKRDEDGKLIFDYEVHIISNLIKVWLRDLPTPLLHHINRAKVEACKNEEEAMEILALLPDPFKSVCQYIVDFLSVVASHHDINRMPPNNLAICFCPNLFKGNPNDQMTTLIFTQKISKWFTMCIQHRVEHPREDGDEELQALTMLFSTESAEFLPISVPTPRNHLKNQNRHEPAPSGVAE